MYINCNHTICIIQHCQYLTICSQTRGHAGPCRSTSCDPISTPAMLRHGGDNCELHRDADHAYASRVS